MSMKNVLIGLVLLIGVSLIGEVQGTALNSVGSPPICAAGGCGAISCAFGGGIGVGLGTVHVDNAIECAAGYYACCHLTAYCFSVLRCPVIPE